MKKALLFQLFILLSVSLAAQDVVLKAEYPAVVTAGQQFSVMWTVNAGGGEVAFPPFTGFVKLMGPQKSYSSSTQIINNRMSTQTSYTYVYFLQAVNEGKFVIPPAVFTLKNKEYRSDSMYIEVISGTSQNQITTQSSTGKTDNEGISSAGGDVFVNLSLNRKEVYLGEHIVATVKLFTKVNLSGINEIKFPSFNGFLKTDIETPPLTSLQQETVNGSVYGTGIVQQFLLFPQVTGEITIDPVQLSVLIQQKSGQSDPFFGDFFTQYQTVPKAIASQTLKIRVKALPGTKPDDFSGIVGKLNLKASLDKDSVNVNDAVSLKITITGSGNLKIAQTPLLKLPPDIEN
jgi:hypothetical protein